MKRELKSSLENCWCAKLKERKSLILEESGPLEGMGLNREEEQTGVWRQPGCIEGCGLLSVCYCRLFQSSRGAGRPGLGLPF